MQNRVFAIIPAAGRSRRMGSPKQLLDVNGRTMLQAVVEPLLASDIGGVLIITHSGLEGSIRAMFSDTRVGIAINDDENSEMIDSIRIGLRAWRERESISDRDGFLVCPGDHPGITTVDFDACIAAFRANPDRIIVAMRGGKRGHPVIFPATDHPFIESERCNYGLNVLVRSHLDRVELVECTSAGIMHDIDTFEDLGKSHHSRLDQPS